MAHRPHVFVLAILALFAWVSVAAAQTPPLPDRNPPATQDGWNSPSPDWWWSAPYDWSQPAYPPAPYSGWAAPYWPPYPPGGPGYYGWGYGWNVPYGPVYPMPYNSPFGWGNQDAPWWPPYGNMTPYQVPDNGGGSNGRALPKQPPTWQMPGQQSG